MNKTPTIRSQSWLIGLILFFYWNVQAESNPPHQSVQFTKFFNISTPPIPPGPNTPISLTATAGVPFKYELPALLIENNAIYSSPELPGNGLRLSYETYPPSIVGAPNATGVMNLTINATSHVNNQVKSAWVPITLTVIAPTPISLTATAGVPFKYELPVLLPSNSAGYSSPQLPGNGLNLSYETYPPSITGTPTASGVINLTVNAHSNVNSQEESAWIPITITVNPPTPISRTATVGQPFRLELPDLLSNRTSISVTGIPANGLHFETGLPPAIQGVPLTAGVMNLTLVNGSATATAWRPIIITVNSEPGSALTLLAPTYNCATGAFRFITTGGDSTPITFSAIGITGPTTNPNQFVDTDLRTAADAQPLHLQATQSGVTVSYVWYIRAQCPVGPTPPASDLTLLAPTYNCATGAFRFNTTGGDGTPITFSAIGITGPTTNPNQFVDTEQRTASDAPPILLQAKQNGTTVTYLWDIRAQCPVNQPGGTLTLLAPTYNCTTGAFHFNTNGGDGSPITYFAVGITGPTNNPDQFVDTDLRTAADAQPLHLQATQSGVTVSYVWYIRAQCPVGPTPPASDLTLLAPTYNCATGAFRFNTTGGDGTPITFSAIGITGPTTNPNQFVDTELRTVNDVQPILLQATQNGTTVIYLWNLKAACGRARLSAAEPARRLSVKLLGNPVVGDIVHIEVSGAEGQPLLVALINQQGRPVSEACIVKATAVERLEVKLGRSPGVHLLQVSTPDQTEVVRVVKSD